MQKVLFVCSGNTCRSPLAEAAMKNMIVKEKAEDSFRTASAGLMTVDGLPASNYAITAAREKNMDLSAHYSQQLQTSLVELADIILTMTAGHKQFIDENWPQAAEKTFLLKEFAGCCGDIIDPFGGSLDDYRHCLSQIQDCLQKAWPILLELAQKKKEDREK